MRFGSEAVAEKPVEEQQEECLRIAIILGIILVPRLHAYNYCVHQSA